LKVSSAKMDACEYTPKMRKARETNNR
jgi:hypothetical protein